MSGNKAEAPVAQTKRVLTKKALQFKNAPAPKRSGRPAPQASRARREHVQNVAEDKKLQDMIIGVEPERQGMLSKQRVAERRKAELYGRRQRARRAAGKRFKQAASREKVNIKTKRRELKALSKPAGVIERLRARETGRRQKGNPFRRQIKGRR